MLIDFENIGYVKCDNILLPTESSYIPASTWGFIKGDITEQKDLVNLINTLEIGLTPEQIELLNNTSNIINEFKTDYYTKREVDNIISNIDVDLTGYATEQWVEDKGYLTEHQSLNDYYNKSEIDDIVNNIDVDLTGYATEQWVEDKGYLTEHQSLVDYAKKQWVLDNYYLKGDIDELLNDTKDDTKDWVTEQGYLSESTLLTDYYTKSEIDDAFTNLEIGITPEQIEIINNLDDKFAGIEYDLSELTSELGDKASADSVYSKSEIDSKHYATENWVTEQGYLTEHQSLDNYYTIEQTEELVFGEIDLIYQEIQNISGTIVIDCDSFENIDFQTITDIYNTPAQRYVIRVGGGDIYNIIQTYAPETTGFLENYSLLLSNLVNNQTVKITTKSKKVTVEYIDIATENWVTEQGYLTEHQSLDNYYNKSETDNKLSNKLDTNLIWSGTQAEWDNLTPEQQASYIIAMIEL
jgi:hypothetical protein